MATQLPDGTEIVIRHIRADDKALLVDGLAHLSPESIHRRFLSPKRRFTKGELRYLTELDHRDHVALLAFLPGDPGHLAAVGRFVRVSDERDTAEAAIVVRDSLQGRGLGKLLALRLADEAARRGIRRFQATMLGDNVAARKLMGTIAERLDDRYAGTGQLELAVELSEAA